jgi:hypothetical protein
MPIPSEPQAGRPSFTPAYPSDPNLALTYDPHTDRDRQPMAGPDLGDGLGMASGWVSTGFGLIELLAPRAFLRAVGMPYPPWLIRLMGARDLVLGLGLLGQPDSPTWRRARFVNDMLDTTVIGAAYAGSRNRRRLSAFAALAAAVVALDARSAHPHARQQED